MVRGRPKKIQGESVERGIRLSQDLAARLDQAVQLTGRPGSDLMRELLDQGLTRLLRETEQEHAQQLRQKIDQVLAGPASVRHLFDEYKDTGSLPVEALVSVEPSWLAPLSAAIHSYRALKAKNLEHTIVAGADQLKRVGSAGTEALSSSGDHVTTMVREILRLFDGGVTKKQIEDLLDQSRPWLHVTFHGLLDKVIKEMTESGFVEEVSSGRYRRRRARSVEEALRALRQAHPGRKADLVGLERMIQEHRFEADVERDGDEVYLVLSRGEHARPPKEVACFRYLLQHKILRPKDDDTWTARLPRPDEG